MVKKFRNIENILILEKEDQEKLAKFGSYVGSEYSRQERLREFIECGLLFFEIPKSKYPFCSSCDTEMGEFDLNDFMKSEIDNNVSYFFKCWNCDNIEVISIPNCFRLKKGLKRESA